jgi:hypothetical protein
MGLPDGRVAAAQARFSVRILRDAPTTNTVRGPERTRCRLLLTAGGAQWRFIVGVIPSSFPAQGKEWVGAINSWCARRISPVSGLPSL